MVRVGQSSDCVTFTVSQRFQKRCRWGSQGELLGQAVEENMGNLDMSLFHLSWLPHSSNNTSADVCWYTA